MSMHIHCHSLNVGVIEKPKNPKNHQVNSWTFIYPRPQESRQSRRMQNTTGQLVDPSLTGLVEGNIYRNI